MKRISIWIIISICVFVRWYGVAGAINYVLGYSSVDEGEIRWGGTTKYSAQLPAAIAVWNAMGKVNIAPDNIYTYEDLRISDTSVGGVGIYAWWQPSSGTDTIKFNKILMDSTSNSTKQSVIAHEFGHALGLEHHYDFANIMYGPISGRTTLGSRDIVDYRYIYGY